MNNNEYCLAMYDVRAKQNYIFRSNHLKEIVGASAIIRDVFIDYLRRAADEYRNYLYNKDEESAIYNLDKDPSEYEPFNETKFTDRMKEDKYLGEVVYVGGGNFIALFKNKDILKEVNKKFTKMVINKTYDLKVICTYVEGVNFDDFIGDRKKLYERHRFTEAINSFDIPSSVIPIIQVDPVTSLPLTKRNSERQSDRGENKVTYETDAKYKKYRNEVLKFKKESSDSTLAFHEGEIVLDKLVEEKGRESLLAIVYIDGNNMGAMFQNALDGKSTYNECIEELRKLSKSTQECFIDKGIEAINTALNTKYKDDNKYKEERRIIVFSGDEVNFVVNATDALDAVKAYFESIEEYNKENNLHFSACAGICIFNSHAPYADAYKIAEECCESGKNRMKKHGENNNNVDAYYVDFHYNQGAIGIDLDSIREKDDTTNKKENGLLSRPWLYKGNVDELFNLDLIDEMDQQLEKVKRTNIKTLFNAAKNSQNLFDLEIQRVIAHSDQKIDFSLGGKLDNKQLRKLMYDVGVVYDLWFRKKVA